jgi:hypothetical protein
MFYEDARKHMSRTMKKNVDNFDEALESCNNYIKSSNEGIDKRIREIISRPVFSRLTDEQTSSICRILKIGLSRTYANSSNT